MFYQSNLLFYFGRCVVPHAFRRNIALCDRESPETKQWSPVSLVMTWHHEPIKYDIKISMYPWATSEVLRSQNKGQTSDTWSIEIVKKREEIATGKSTGLQNYWKKIVLRNCWTRDDDDDDDDNAETLRLPKGNWKSFQLLCTDHYLPLSAKENATSYYLHGCKVIPPYRSYNVELLRLSITHKLWSKKPDQVTTFYAAVNKWRLTDPEKK